MRPRLQPKPQRQTVVLILHLSPTFAATCISSRLQFYRSWLTCLLLRPHSASCVRDLPPTAQASVAAYAWPDNLSPSAIVCRAQELPFIASMGIYVAKASAIRELLMKHFPSQHDFGSDIIPGAKDLGFHVQVLLQICALTLKSHGSAAE